MNFARFWAELRRRIDSEIESTAVHLLEGRAADEAQYREKVGYVRGIKFVLDEARHIMGEDEAPKPQQTEEENG